MKQYFIMLPLSIVAQSGPHLLGLVDEDTLRMAITLLDRERELAALQQEHDRLQAKLETLEALERLTQ